MNLVNWNGFLSDFKGFFFSKCWYEPTVNLVNWNGFSCDFGGLCSKCWYGFIVNLVEIGLCDFLVLVMVGFRFINLKRLCVAGGVGLFWIWRLLLSGLMWVYSEFSDFKMGLCFLLVFDFTPDNGWFWIWLFETGWIEEKKECGRPRLIFWGSIADPNIRG